MTKKNSRVRSKVYHSYPLELAVRCYELALEKGYTEEYARQIFLAGQTMSLGYYFSNKTEEYKEITRSTCIELFGTEMQLTAQDIEIIDTAKLTTYPVTGDTCDAYRLLSNLEIRFGTESEEYKSALKRAKELGLVQSDFKEKEEEAVETNSHGVNKKIQAHILDDKIMEEIGFTEYRKGFLYFCRILDRELDISFSVTIPRDGSDIRIDVLDEAFCQPYDYQSILRDNPEHKTALRIQKEVEKWMEYLTEKGVLTGHIKGEYI